MSLRCVNISVRRGGHTILNDLSIELKPGRLLAVLGQNGAGKSSLRKVLSGEWAPDAGHVELDGIPLPRFDTAELARRRAVLPQEPRLNFPFTVQEVVQVGRYPWIGTVTPAEDQRIIADALHQVGLADLHTALYTRLSGGEKQRLHLARVLAQLEAPPGAKSQTRILFLDEPTNNLDLAGRHLCLSLAQRLAQKGAAVLAVLHDPNDAWQYADEVCLLHQGRLIHHGPAKDVLTAANLSDLFQVRIRMIQEPNGPCLFYSVPEPRDPPEASRSANQQAW